MEVDFRNLEMCTETYIADEAMEILGRFFSGISPDLPLMYVDSEIISLYETRVQRRSDGKYKIDILSPNGKLPFIEKNPGSDEYVLYVNGKPYGENTDCI